MPGPKPLYRKNKLVVLKRALPGAQANTPMIVMKIIRGRKRDNFMTRYEVIDNNGVHYFVYESDLG